MVKLGAKRGRAAGGFCRRGIGMVIAAIVACPAAAADWPQWGGPGRDFTVKSAKLAETWSEEGPRKLWSRDLGAGYSSITVGDDTLYTMYRDGDDEIVIAMKAGSGETVWEYRYAAPAYEKMETRFGKGPNATPLIKGKHLYTIGGTGRIHCLARDTGKVVWSHDGMKEYNATPPEFGYSSSPLAYKNTVIVHVGGKGHGLVAFNDSDGSIAWAAQDFVNTYSSPILINVDGQQQLVLVTDRAVVGVNPDDGDLLWQHKHQNQWNTNILTPVWGDDNMLYVSSGGDAGSRGLRLSVTEGKTTVEEVWKTRKVKIGQGNAVRIGDYIYGPSGSHQTASFMACINAKTGRIAWRKRGHPSANAVYADGKLVVLDSDGRLALARVTPEAFTILSTVALFDDRSWTVPTIAGSRMYVRDAKRILAMDLQ